MTPEKKPTITGRIINTDPPLQNIPIRTEDGKRLRELFAAWREGITNEWWQEQVRKGNVR